MPPTWDEYLAALTEYLRALHRAVDVGFALMPSPPERPRDPFPDESRDVVNRLREECDRLTSDVTLMMATIANRPPSYTSPHWGRPAAYVIADI